MQKWKKEEGKDKAMGSPTKLDGKQNRSERKRNKYSGRATSRICNKPQPILKPDRTWATSSDLTRIETRLRNT